MKRFITIRALDMGAAEIGWKSVAVPVANVTEVRADVGMLVAPWNEVQSQITMKDGVRYYTSLSLDEVTEKLNA